VAVLLQCRPCHVSPRERSKAGLKLAAFGSKGCGSKVVRVLRFAGFAAVSQAPEFVCGRPRSRKAEGLRGQMPPCETKRSKVVQVQHWPASILPQNGIMRNSPDPFPLPGVSVGAEEKSGFVQQTGRRNLPV